MTSLQGQSDEMLLQIIWSYLGFRTQLQKADVIIACGSHDLYVAREAARLYERGLAPKLVTSGGFNSRLGAVEAEAFAEKAIELGVSGESIIRECTARHLGDNIRFSMQLLKQLGIKADTIILVSTPIAALQAYATFIQQFPTVPPEVLVHHETIGFGKYAKRFGREDTIERMLKYFANLQTNIEQGCQEEMDIPDPVQIAYDTLDARGYRSRGLHE